ncbi:MAG: oligosaccharide flippase family protein [Pseudomonadota bacterium]
MSFLRHTVQSAGAGLIMTLSRFMAMAIIARTLGVESFGLLTFSVFCIDLIALLALAGLPGATARFSTLASLDERPGLARMLAIWLLVACIVSMLAAPLVAIWVIELGSDGVLLFTGWSILAVVQTAGAAKLQGAMRFDLITWANAAGAFAIVVGALVLVRPEEPLTAFTVLAITITIQALPVVLLWLGIAKPAPPRSDRPGLPERREMLVYGANVWLTSLTTAIVWGRGEILVIEAMLDERALGIYGAAMTLMAMVWRMTQMLQGAVAPHLSRKLQAPGDEFETFVAGITRLTLAISTCSALVLAWGGRELAILVFGVEFARSGEILAIIAPGAAVAGVGTVNLATQYLSNGRFNRNAVVVAAAVLLGLACLLILWADALGAGLARAIVLMGLAIAMPLWMIGAGYAKLSIGVIYELLGAVLLVICASLTVLILAPDIWIKAVSCFVMAYLVLGRATGSFVPWHMVRGGVRALRAL